MSITESYLKRLAEALVIANDIRSDGYPEAYGWLSTAVETILAEHAYPLPEWVKTPCWPCRGTGEIQVHTHSPVHRVVPAVCDNCNGSGQRIHENPEATR